MPPRADDPAHPLYQPRFLVALLLVAPALLAGYALPRDLHGPAGQLLAGYLRLCARLGAAIVHPIDPAARAIGFELRGRASVIVANGYDAIDVILPFAAAVLVFPATLQRRAVAIALNVLWLSALNLARIASRYWFALKGTTTLELADAEIFRVFMVTLAIVGFFAWARWVTQPRAHQGFTGRTSRNRGIS